MNTKLGGTVLSILVILAVLPADLAAEKRGAQLEIRMLDGRTIVGELVAVRGDKLILKDEATSADATVSILDVRVIKAVIRTNSGHKRTSALGVIGGVAAGLVLGGILGSKLDKPQTGLDFGPPPGALAGMLIGATAGGILAAGAPSRTVVYSIGITTMRDALDRLRSMAAIQEAN